MGLLDADPATNGNRILEYYRYTVYGEATVLPIVDDGSAAGSTAGDRIEDTPLDLGDNNTLMLAERASIAKFGRVSRFANTYTYTGRRLDEKTGLHYYRYRYYEARQGRFVSRDPIKSPRRNVYGYVGNKVTHFVDPQGLEQISGHTMSASWIPKGSLPWFVPGTLEDDDPTGADGASLEHFEEELEDGNLRFVNYLSASITTSDGQTIDSGQFNESSKGYMANEWLGLGVKQYPVKQKMTRTTSGCSECMVFRQIVGARTTKGDIAFSILQPFIPFGDRIGKFLGNFPPIWTVLELTLCADGSQTARLADFSLFPKHQIYRQADGAQASAGKWTETAVSLSRNGLNYDLDRWKDHGWGDWDSDIDGNGSIDGNPWGVSRCCEPEDPF